MGAVDNFFYRHLAGINSDPLEPGFKKIVFKPNFIKSLDFAEASYKSLQGEVIASWKQTEPDKFEYRVTLPPNTKAELVLPGKTQILEPGSHTFEVEL